MPPARDQRVTSGAPPGEAAARAAEDTPSAGDMAALPSAAGVAASTSTKRARIISAPVPAEPQDRSSPNGAKTLVVSRGEMTSTPATSEPAALATGNAPSPAPAAGAPYAAPNPTDTAPASAEISIGPAPSATTAPAAS